MAKPISKDLKAMARRLRMMALAEMHQRSDSQALSEEEDLSEGPVERFVLPDLVLS